MANRHLCPRGHIAGDYTQRAPGVHGYLETISESEPFRALAALCRRWSVGHRSVRRAILRAIELGFDDLSSRPSRPLGAEQFGGALPSRKPLATLSAALGRVRAFAFRVA